MTGNWRAEQSAYLAGQLASTEAILSLYLDVGISPEFFEQSLRMHLDDLGDKVGR